MNRLKNVFAFGAFSLLVLALPAIASAQYRDDDYSGGRYGNSGGYGNNGRYGNYGRGDIRGVLQNLKNKAKNLEGRSDRIDDRNDDRYNGSYGNRYSNLEGLADSFRGATDRLADAYGRGRNLNNSVDEARRVLDIGSQIDQELYRTRGGRNFANRWQSVRGDLQIIADTYNLNYYNQRGRNRNNGGWRDRMPFPLPY